MKMLLFLRPGCFIALIQWTWVLLASAPDSLEKKLVALTQWDGNWFCSVVEYGYLNEIPLDPNNVKSVNLAFFPGYPMLARIVARIFFLPERMGLLAASFLSAIVFWSLLWKLTAHLSQKKRILTTLLILSFPTSFYMVAAYSEGLFLASALMVAFLYLHSREPLYAGLAAGLTGATRLVGVPLGFIPFLHSCIARWALRSKADFPTGRSVVVPLLAALGSGAYFIFCWLKFGEPFLPLRAHQIGWGVQPMPEALVSRFLWDTDLTFSWVSFDFRQFDITTFSSFCASVFAWCLLLSLGWWIWLACRSRQEPGLAHALFYGLCAIITFVLPIVSFYRLRFFSVPRYMFPVMVFLSLAWIHMPPPPWQPRIQQGLLAVAVLCGFLLQYLLILRFTSLLWVA